MSDTQQGLCPAEYEAMVKKMKAHIIGTIVEDLRSLANKHATGAEMTAEEEKFHLSAFAYDPKRDAPDVTVKCFSEWRDAKG